MNKTIDLQKASLLGPALKNGLEGLAYLIAITQDQKSDYGFFSHLCNFIVPFIRKSCLLQPLHDDWTNQRNEHARKSRKLQSQAVKEITEACQILKQRVTKSRIKIRKEILTGLAEIEEVLETGGPYLGPAFYETAASKLKSICSILAKKNQKKLLTGIANIAYRDAYKQIKDQQKLYQQPYLEQVYFYGSLIELDNQKAIMKWEKVDKAWAIWEYLCLAEQCWHLPQSYFKEQGLPMGSAQNVQKSNHLFNLRGYWYEMQCIRNQRIQNNPPISFTREYYSAYLEHLTSAIVYFHSLQNSFSSEKTSTPIYAIELKLDANEVHLIVEWQKGGEVSIYCLHACQEGSAPLCFIQELMENVGNKVPLTKKIDPGDQSTAKLLTNLNINNPLRNLFFSKGEKRAVTLLRTRAVLEEHSKIDSVEITQYIINLGLPQIEGAFSRINYKKV